MKLSSVGCYAALLILIGAPTAAAQPAPPQYQSSEPSEGDTVHRAPNQVEVTFDQPLDESSSLTVTDECDRAVDDGSTEVSGNSMSIELTKKPSGHYHVTYVARGLAGLTGTSEGHFTFTAHAGPSCDGSGNGHGNHNGNGNGHGNHNGNGHNGEHENHGSGEEHSGAGHGSGSEHDGHTSMATGADHGDHAGGGGDHESGAHAAEGNGGPAAASGPDFGITSSDTARELLSRADSTTLLISLALCAALGIAGGVVLRATAK